MLKNFFLLAALLVVGLNLIEVNSIFGSNIGIGFSLNYFYGFLVLLLLFLVKYNHELVHRRNFLLYLFFYFSYTSFASVSLFINEYIYFNLQPNIDRIGILISGFLGLLTCMTTFYWFSMSSTKNVVVAFKLIFFILCVGNSLTIFQFVTQQDWVSGERSADVGWQLVERASGVYFNPNNAGFVAIVSIVICLFLRNFLRKRKFILWVLCMLSVIAGILTFSKTFMFLVLLVGIVNYIFRYNLKTAETLRKFPDRMFQFFVFTVLIFFTLKSTDVLEFSDEQFDRISVVLKVFSSSSSDLTTGRTELAQFAIELISRQWIIGYGIGFFTDMIGSELVHHGISQGVHNFFLRIWGDSGIFVFIIFVIFLISLLNDVVSVKCRERKLLLFGLMSSYLAVCFTSHNISESLIINLVLGIIIGLLSRQDLVLVDT